MVRINWPRSAPLNQDNCLLKYFPPSVYLLNRLSVLFLNCSVGSLMTFQSMRLSIVKSYANDSTIANDKIANALPNSKLYNIIIGMADKNIKGRVLYQNAGTVGGMAGIIENNIPKLIALSQVFLSSCPNSSHIVTHTFSVIAKITTLGNFMLTNAISFGRLLGFSRT